MDQDRRTVALAGVLYMLGTICGLIGVSLSQPIVDDAAYLSAAGQRATSLYAGATLELLMGLSLLGMALAVYPILSRYDVRVAVGYVALRLAEFVIFILGAVSLLSLVTLSQSFAAAGAPAGALYDTVGRQLLAARDWGGHVVLDVAVFPIGALLFYGVLYRARLVPRWLSGWGLIGAVLYWAAGFLVLFDVLVPLTTAHVVLQAPLGIQEIVLAVWMIGKGFAARPGAA